VYDDTVETIEKENPMLKYEYFYKTVPKDNEASEEFGPFNFQSITDWLDGDMLNDTDTYSVMFKVKGEKFESNWFNKGDVNFKIYL